VVEVGKKFLITCDIIGIELLNEPQPPSDDTLLEWYTMAIARLVVTSHLERMLAA
jgi:hypothetical protein